MPGLTGFIHPQLAEADASTLDRMAQSLHQEPFYSSGKLLDSRIGLAIGWTSHTGSYTDCLPIWNENRDIALLLAGECYLDPSRYQALRSAGHSIHAEDASALIHLYEDNPDNFLRSLNGTFTGVLADFRSHDITVFNDRFGLGRLYIHQDSDRFYFSAEVKSLLAALPHLRKLDLPTVAETIVCGCALRDRTIFPDISLLPPGTAVTFSRGRLIRRQEYFRRQEWEEQSLLSPSEYFDELKHTFNRVLPRYFQGRHDIALSLTGGLDSRMIIAGLRDQRRNLPCFTFGGMYRDSEDVKVSRQIAEICQRSHEVIRVSDAFFPEFLDLAQKAVSITDGAMDVSGAVGLYANRAARDFGLVRMTGNYGSEILRLSVAFKPASVFSPAFAEPLSRQFQSAAETYRSEKAQDRLLSFIAYKQVPWHHFARFAQESSQITVRAPYLDNDLVKLAYRAPADLLLNKKLAYRYTTDMQPALSGAPTDRGTLDKPNWIPSKAYLAWKEFLPKAEYAFDYGMPNLLAKIDQAMAPLRLERLFLGQQKYYHFRSWYRHQLSSVVKQVLLDPATLGRPYLERRAVEQIVDRHTRGTENHTTAIHRLLTLEFTQRQLIDP